MPKGYKPAGSGRKAKEEGNPLLVTKCLSLSPQEVARIDALRGEQTWAAWLREAVIEKMNRIQI
jgi:hypothetical protein